MKIHIAKRCGFCFGVERAVAIAEKACKLTEKAQTLGPIIHNPQVVEALGEKGVTAAHSLAEIDSGNVIIRSHGVGPEIYKEAKEKGLKIIDATCPHVKKAQMNAKSVIDNGYDLIILGERNHPEVISINQWGYNKGTIVETEKEAENIKFSKKIGIVVQTTFSQSRFSSIIDTLKQKAETIKVFKTICNATEERQNAAIELAKTVDIMVVIGGKNSGNTRRLKEVCKETGCSTYHIETSTELNPSWFENVQTVGVTAGASTPDWIIKEVISRMNFEELLNQSMAEEPKKGNVVEGTVVQVEEDKAYVSIPGCKTEATLNAREISYPAPENVKDVLEPNQEVKVVIISHIKEDSPIYLSMTRLAKDEDWNFVREAQEKGETVEAEGLEAIPAGLVVKVKSLRGFIPLSQGDVRFVRSLANLVDTKFDVKVLEIDERKNRLVLSRRAVLEVARQARLEEAMEKLEVGETYKGIVRKIMPYGAFVDIGGIEGLLHISDISWKKIRKVEDVLTVGQEINVKLQSLDKDSKKISLSLKALTKSPWEEAEETIHVGDVLTGKVMRLVVYGAFVAVNEDIQGLLHISQITKQRNANVEDYLTRGQEVEVKVLSFSKEDKKLGLALTEMFEAKPATEEDAE